MANKSLHGNVEDCPACALRREEFDKSSLNQPVVPCNLCGSTMRIALDDRGIVDRSVRWAREHYWPQRLARWAIQNGDNVANTPISGDFSHL